MFPQSNRSGRDPVWSPGPFGSSRPKLLAHYQGVGDHVAEALVLLGGENRYERHKLEEYFVDDAQHGPQDRGPKAGDTATILPHYLNAE
jgi:hypothetical protein